MPVIEPAGDPHSRRAAAQQILWAQQAGPLSAPNEQLLSALLTDLVSHTHGLERVTGTVVHQVLSALMAGPHSALAQQLLSALMAGPHPGHAQQQVILPLLTLLQQLAEHNERLGNLEQRMEVLAARQVDEQEENDARMNGIEDHMEDIDARQVDADVKEQGLPPRLTLGGRWRDERSVFPEDTFSRRLMI